MISGRCRLNGASMELFRIETGGPTKVCCRSVPRMQWYMPLCARVVKQCLVWLTQALQLSLALLRLVFAGCVSSIMPCLHCHHSTLATKFDKSAMQN